MISGALAGKFKDDLLKDFKFIPHELKVAAILDGEFISKAESQIKGSGYCVASLEASLWCFFNTESFEAAVLRAANLGDDVDTTAAITGQIAGAYYGAAAIRADWVEKLSMREEIEEMANQLYKRFYPGLTS